MGNAKTVQWLDPARVVGARCQRCLRRLRRAGERRSPASHESGRGKKGQNRTKGVGMRLYVEMADNIDEVASRATAAGIL